MTNRIAEAARRAAETLESRAFHGGRPIDERCWLDPAGWAPDGAAALRRHRNCRCVLDLGDPGGDQTVISVQGPDGTYHRLRNLGVVSVGLIGAAHVPEDVEPLAPPPTWLRKYRPR